MSTAKKTENDRDCQGRFSSGNTLGQGRPKGALNKSTRMAREALQARSGEIMDTLINNALNGNEAALRLCIERLVPVAKERPLPPVELGDDPKAAIRELLKEGLLTPSELVVLSKVPAIHNFDDDLRNLFGS